MDTSLSKLTKAEEEVMQLIWDHGPATVSQLIEQLEAPRPPHSTISSIIRILESKGFVVHKTYGRTHEYYAAIDKKSYTHFSLKKLVANYFEGSMNELVSFLVKENDLSLKDLEEIKNKYKQ
ncbi:MAG TPA: BlaI/MecI/CopY family transcriptional regulator [Saprospiraceae bacterium]|nr:BlaI/MecI/CopY family transcriptional regulator [Saprospiraceae bacterium]